MISNSLEFNVTYKSNAVVEELESAFTKEIAAQQDIAKREKNLQPNPLELGNTYIRILAAGGHLGC